MGSLDATTLENLGGPVIVLEPGGAIVHWNRACSELTGRALDEVRGRPLWDLLPLADEATHTRDVLRQLRADGRPRRFETTWVLGGDERRIVALCGSLVPGEDGQARLVLSGVDVTELVSAREADLSRLRALLQQAPAGIFVADLEGRITDVNDAACQLLGYTRDELVGRSATDFLPPGDLGRFWTVRDRLLDGGVQIADWTARRRDGTYIPVEASMTILPDGRWQALVRDISTRERLQRELRQSHADLNRAQAVAKVGSWRLDLQRDELLWTDETYHIFEIPVGTPMSYQAFLARVHPDDRAHVDRAWRAALRGEPYSLEHRIVTTSGPKWVFEKADLELDEHGALLGGIGIVQDITERKRAEHALEESAERFRALVDASAQVVWTADADGAGLESPSWRVFTGQAEEPQTVEGLFDAIHPEDGERMRALWTHALDTRTAVTAECRVPDARGEWRWTLARAVPLLRADGSARGWVGMLSDTTERKRLEDELRLSEAKFSGIIDASADAIISIDEDQRITVFNEAAVEAFGHSKEEAIGAHLDILIPERFRAAHHQHVERFATGPQATRRMNHRGSILGLRKNGEEFPVDAALSRLDLDGTKLMTVALRDVTAQRRFESDQQFLAEVGLTLSATLDYERTLRSVAELPARHRADLSIVSVVDEDGDVRPAKAACRDPSMAWVCDALVQAGVDTGRRSLLWSVMETKKPVVVSAVSVEALASLAQSEEQLEALRAVRPRSLIAAPLLAYGKVLGAVTLVSWTPSLTYGPADVGVVARLGRRAAMALENARLYEAAQRAIRARDDVLGVVAHDLRNPLNTLAMQAQLLPEKPARVLERAVRRMDRLIRDILDVTRMEAGHLAMELESLPAEQLVSESVEALKPLASAASLELRLDAAPDLPAVRADHDRLLQVIENLVGNAVKFTPRGGRITLGAAPRAHEVLFWVSDTGPGISSEEVRRIFDRFWQARQTERRGAGLGLAIVKAIVEAHGGRIWVESQLGSGTTFYFTVAVAEPARAEARQPPLGAPRHSR